MNLRSMNPAGYTLRGNHLTVALVVFGIVAAYFIASYIVAEDISELSYIALACAACGLAVRVLSNWRQGVAMFLVWILFEDLVRKYLGNNMAVYFGKDFLAALFYLSFFVAVRKQKIRVFHPPFRIPLLLMIWFGVLQVFNPASPSIFFGLMGLKMFFFYVPLMLIGYHLFSSESDLQRFFFLNAVLLLIISS